MPRRSLSKSLRAQDNGTFVGQFAVSNMGSVMCATFYAFDCSNDGERPELFPAFTALMTREDITQLRDVLDTLLHGSRFAPTMIR
jgi:hypothetical protein